jgi:uncharacterized membrane protein YagU involved in acid resistance
MLKNNGSKNNENSYYYKIYLFHTTVLLLHTLEYVDFAYVFALYYSVTSEIRAEFCEC